MASFSFLVRTLQLMFQCGVLPFVKCLTTRNLFFCIEKSTNDVYKQDEQVFLLILVIVEKLINSLIGAIGQIEPIHIDCLKNNLGDTIAVDVLQIPNPRRAGFFIGTHSCCQELSTIDYAHTSTG